MTRFEILEKRQDLEAARKTGYLTAREYVEARKELEQAWKEMLKRERQG